MTGAYKTTVRYQDWNGASRVVYRPDLPEAVRRFVVHDSDAMDTPTDEDIPVVLNRAFHKHVTPGEPVPGCLWVSGYVWPPPEPHTPTRVPAPQAEQDAFVAGMQAVQAAVNKNVARHYKTHADLPEDPVVKAVDYLRGLADRAEEIA